MGGVLDGPGVSPQQSQLDWARIELDLETGFLQLEELEVVAMSVFSACRRLELQQHQATDVASQKGHGGSEAGDGSEAMGGGVASGTDTKRVTAMLRVCRESERRRQQRGANGRAKQARQQQQQQQGPEGVARVQRMQQVYRDGAARMAAVAANHDAASTGAQAAGSQSQEAKIQI